MKYLKYFELARTGNQLDYDVGDIVVCVSSFYKNHQERVPILEKDKNYFYDRYKRLFYLSNDFKLDYQPRVMVFVEGGTEQKILPEIFMVS